jgi:DegV family protein with EDD domain
MGLGWQVLAAARAREAGGDVADILAAVEAMRQRVKLYISLDTLEYLYRGGRIGNARRLVGAMLNIKPMVYVDPLTGMTESFGVAMTRHKGIDQLFTHFFEQLDTSHPLHVAVLHGNAPEDARELCERINAQYHPAELLTNITCPILGLNTGPKALALSGYCE